MTREERYARKRELGYSNKMIAELSGVPLGTVQKVFSGASKAPRYETLQAIDRVLFGSPAIRNEHMARNLEDALAERHRVPDDASQAPSPASNGADYAAIMEETMSRRGRDVVQEHNLAMTWDTYREDPAGLDRKRTEASPDILEEARTRDWSRQGTYTVEDYFKLPHEVRVELIDGVIYDMASPAPVHQFIAGAIFNIFFNYKLQNQDRFKNCMPYIAPLDVQLDKDDRTMVQPDVLVACDQMERGGDRLRPGAPAFVLEVLSESTRRKDVLIKTNKYMSAGVRELWLVDPMNERVTVYDFEHDRYPIQYSFEDDVPVAISEGELIVHFAKISAMLRAFYG